MSDTRYIRFEDPGSDPEPSFVAKTLSVIMGSSNPDFDEAYQRVDYWWLEIDHKGQVLREIGFDTLGHVVAIAPLGRNYGVFTDSGSLVVAAESDVEMSEFIDAWQAAEQAFVA